MSMCESARGRIDYRHLRKIRLCVIIRMPGSGTVLFRACAINDDRECRAGGRVERYIPKEGESLENRRIRLISLVELITFPKSSRTFAGHAHRSHKFQLKPITRRNRFIDTPYTVGFMARRRRQICGPIKTHLPIDLQLS